MKFAKSTNRTSDELITIDTFKGGSNSLLDQARMDPKFAVESINMLQVEDGLWSTRWGTKYYGASHASTIDGACEYVKSDGTTELITITNGTAYKSTDGGTLTALTGATFTAGVQCFFLQIAGWDNTNKTYGSYLYIVNGTDSIARYNGTTLESYTQISAPASLAASLVASGLTSGTYNYYAQVTALNGVGETVGSTEASVTTNKLRDNWTAGTDKVVWSWGSVSGATRYQLYMSDQSGYEQLLTDTSTTNFTDDGTVELNPYVTVPLANTTGGPKIKSLCVSNNRTWGTGNPNDPYAVYWSGTGKDIGNFSDFYGGGIIWLERGGRETPVAVKHYQSGSGQGIATVLSTSPDGRGAVWQVSIEGLTVGDTSFSVPSASKVVGSFGTESLAGVVQTTNDLMFPNRKGWFSLGPEKNYYGILRTNELSSNIRPYWRSLAGSKMNTICSYFYDSKVFISVPTSSSGNDRIIVYDLERNNWSVDWSIGARQFLEYTDSSKMTHLLYVPLSGTKLIELSENFNNDLGVAFNQSYVSPLLPVSKTKTDILSFKEAVVELATPTGSINFQILGIGKTNSFSTIGTRTITDFGSNTGVGTDLPGEQMPSSTQSSVSGGADNWALYLLDAPSTYTQAITKKAIKKRAKLYAIQFKVSSTTADTRFVLLSLQAKGKLIKKRLPSDWTG